MLKNLFNTVSDFLFQRPADILVNQFFRLDGLDIDLEAASILYDLETR